MIHRSLTLRASALAAAIILASAAPLYATNVVATVTDGAGDPLANAVVSVAPAGGTSAQPSAALFSATIDQKDEMFVPEVVVVHNGGVVVFHNSDRTRHHVYSFSPIKRFEFVQDPDDASQPVRFEQPGVAAIGCNMHDQMIAWVYVTKAPWAAVTDEAGQARITDLPAGDFIATVWHPRLRPGTKASGKSIAVATQDTTLALTVPVLQPRRTPHGDGLH